MPVMTLYCRWSHDHLLQFYYSMPVATFDTEVAPHIMVAEAARSATWWCWCWDWDPQYLGQLTSLTSTGSSQLATAVAGIMREIFTIVEPHNNISLSRENQFLAKVTALSAVSEQGELQFWLLCISTSITIFLWDWVRWRTVREILIIYS